MLIICVEICRTLYFFTFFDFSVDFKFKTLYNHYKLFLRRIKMLEFIKSHHKRTKYFIIALFGIVLLLLSFVLFDNLFNVNFISAYFSENQQTIFILKISLENWCTILTMIGTFLAAFWAIHQYDKNNRIKQQEKSAQIAKIFSGNLLESCDIIISVFSQSKLSEIIDFVSHHHNLFENFTTNELREIFENDNFPNIYKGLRKNSNLDDLYYSILEAKVTTIDEYINKYKEDNDNSDKTCIKLHHYTTKEASNLFVYRNKDLPFHFTELIDDVLNELEYICMDISSNAASTNYIYQSLHQIFFDTINCLAIEISLRNDGKYSDKFFTNIIHVYTSWKKIYNKKLEKEKNKKHKNIKTLTPKIETI